MTIPPRFLDEIRSRLTLSDIIGKRVKVIRAGREFKACCPFHREKTPSFTINDDKQFYHCFGCGAHGDVIGFVMQHDNLSFIDAVEMLSAEAGLQMPKPDPQAVQKAEKAKSLHGLMDQATAWFSDQLYKSENKEILDYLTGRGMKQSALSDFRIGYAPADGQALRSYLKGEGYTDADMIEAGLLKPSSKGGEPYIFFRERIMFPVSDRRGRVVAFGGRALPDHLQKNTNRDFTPPKYINSSDTPLFDKGRMLYGESLARQNAREGHTVIVTEGYMDVIACHQAGFRGAVAPMGTALTEDQILLLWSMIPGDEKSPVLCFDGDEAGRRAASRSCERILPLLKPGQSVRFAFLPEGEDPDSMLRDKNAESFRSVLDAALSLFDFIWASHTAGRDFRTPESRAGVVKALQQKIHSIAERDVQGHYKALLQEKVSETFFGGGRDRSYRKKDTKPAALKPRRPVKSSDIYAKIFLASFINYPLLFESMEEMCGRFSIEDRGLNRVRQELITALENDHALDSEGLQNHLKQCGLDKEMGDILSESVYVHAAFARPGGDENTVRQRLSGWLSELDSRNWKEISAGWSEAYRASSEEEVEKLRNMIKFKTHEEH